MSQRTSEQWARPVPEGTGPEVQVLIPSFNRPAELAVTLAGLAGQVSPDFAVIISDQSEQDTVWDTPAVRAMVGVLRAQGREVTLERHLPRRGLAEQRHYLLAQSTAPLVLFLDDDVWLEPRMLARLLEAMAAARCGFIGAAVQGLSYLDDDRPAERTPFEPWNGPVRAERIRRQEPGFERWTLHNAANLAHLAAGKDLEPGQWLLYKVAWIGGCVLYDRQALLECGGFEFWRELPPNHSGEDVAAQWRVMERFGGAGILPSGAVHLEAPTTIAEREVDAFDIVLH